MILLRASVTTPGWKVATRKRSSDPPRWHASGPPNHKEATPPMAKEKPTDGARVVPLALSIERRPILRHQIEIWLAGEDR